ncbi:MAG: TerB family tellurite resistance protein [Bacteroidales bacterium]|nr:TerB family tellurite resistance protein [Bacteroidales bacterium]MBR5019982.1 TerB family tellurite resistance protein [Bacteroidales bacterium]
MEFTAEEKQAVISLMCGIIEADGWIDDEEIEFAQDVLDAIECEEEDFELGQDMPLLPALVILKNMTDEQKGVVSDVITATIVADRIITTEEAVIFDYVSELTGIDIYLDEEEKQQEETLKDLATEAD